LKLLKGRFSLFRENRRGLGGGGRCNRGEEERGGREEEREKREGERGRGEERKRGRRRQSFY